MIGLYFEKESKRFLNFKGENRKYGWQNNGYQERMKQTQTELVEVEGDLIFGDD
jgi:hypothetical protein